VVVDNTPAIVAIMVLAELGGKLRESLRKLHASAAASESGQGEGDDEAQLLLERRVAAVASEISRALVEADVSVRVVARLRDAIVARSRREVLEAAAAAGGRAAPGARRGGGGPRASPARLVQRIVVEELIALVSPAPPSSSSSLGAKPARDRALAVKRGKTSVVLFVGLQGACFRSFARVGGSKRTTRDRCGLSQSRGAPLLASNLLKPRHFLLLFLSN
jgi:hypothetical protein